MSNVVLDTNVIISGLIFGGKPGQILDAVKDGRITAYTSRVLISELMDVLTDKSPDHRTKMQDIEHMLTMVFRPVTPKTVPTVLRDTPDNQVLAVTHEAIIEAIITGDKKLLELREYHNVLIMTVDRFLN